MLHKRNNHQIDITQTKCHYIYIYIRCTMLKFVTQTFDIEVGRIINVKELYKLFLLAVLKTIPLPARWGMYKLLEHLMSFVYNDKRNTEPQGSRVSNKPHRPFNLITQMTFGLSDIDLVLTKSLCRKAITHPATYSSFEKKSAHSK